MQRCAAFLASALLLLPGYAYSFPVPKGEKATTVAGTTWKGSTSWDANTGKTFEITFQADGTLVYHPDRTCNGRWKMEGKTITWDINNYSHFEGRLDGESFAGTGRNNANQTATFSFKLNKR